MVSEFPTSLDNLPKPGPTHQQDDEGFFHDELHAGVARAVEAVQQKVGVDESTDEQSLDFSSRALRAKSVTNWYTILAEDAGSVLEVVADQDELVIVPTEAEQSIPIGTVVEIFQVGDAEVTITPGSGVTIQSPLGETGARTLQGPFSSASLRKRDTDTWALVGGLL